MQLPWLYCVSMTTCECFFVQKNIRVFFTEKSYLQHLCTNSFNAILHANVPYFVILLCLMPDNFTRPGIIWQSAGSQKIF
jgi:hypothetical protein